MMRSLFSGVAGLRNHQTKMDVIGDNISNVNTIGFKKSTVNFQDLLVQTMRGASAPQGGRGGINAMQVGLGMGLGSINVVNTQGNLQNTGKTTDLAIDGDGFFVVSDGTNRFYSRTGTLDIDKNGDLIMASNGLKVVGWSPDPTTKLIDTTKAVGNITIPVGTSIAAQATKVAVYNKNLDSDTNSAKPINTSVTIYDSLGAAHDINIKFIKPTTSVIVPNEVFDNTDANTHTESFSVYDATGALRNLTMTITTNGANWDYSLQEGATVLASGSNQPLATFTNGVAVNSGNLSFTLKYPGATSGTYSHTATDVTYESTPNSWKWLATSTDPTVTIATGGGPNNLVFSDTGAWVSGGGDIVLNFTNGATNGQTVKIDLSSLTQYAEESTITGATDGYTSGSLQSIALDSNGVITGSFSNGITQSLGQVALAVFSNPGGLTRVGGSLYKESNNSGDAQIGTSGNGGRGKITPGALEMANVDLAQEFTDMIITQRGFQANSKIITTTDEMLELLANLKR